MAAFHDEVSSAMLAAGLISIISCLAVMFSFYNKPKLWRNKHNRLIFYIAAADLLGAIGMSFGLTKDNTVLCQAQVFLTNAPPLWSTFWTVVVAYNVVELLRRPVLRSVEALGTEHVSWKVHAVIWSIPVMATFGILTTNRFGCSPGEDPCWCYIGERSDSPNWGTKFWTVLSFYLWEWLALLIFVCLFGYAMYKFRSDRSADAKVRRLLVQKLIGYPVIIIMCWFPAMFTDVEVTMGRNSMLANRGTYLLYVCLPTLQGAFTAIFFFSMQIYNRVVKRKFQPAILVDFFSSLHPLRRLSYLRAGGAAGHRHGRDVASTAKMDDIKNDFLLDFRATNNIRGNPNNNNAVVNNISSPARPRNNNPGAVVPVTPQPLVGTAAPLNSHMNNNNNNNSPPAPENQQLITPVPIPVGGAQHKPAVIREDHAGGRQNAGNDAVAVTAVGGGDGGGGMKVIPPGGGAFDIEGQQ